MTANMFVWYRPRQMSHHCDFNSFPSKNLLCESNHNGNGDFLVINVAKHVVIAQL